MTKTTIEWTDATWNPVTGCTEVSPGCDHCYARRVAERFGGSKAFPHGFNLTLHEDRLQQPRRWLKPRRIFVNSMSDLFHKDVPDAFIDRVFDTMNSAAQHTYQILTKRPERMRRVVADYYAYTEASSVGFLRSVPLPNVWLGVSIESNAFAWRADMLRETPAAVRFLSLEPLLGPIDAVDFTGIDWVIVGGESGPGARPMARAWVRDVRDRCVAAGIRFFFKQWGEWTPDFGNARRECYLDGDFYGLVGKKRAGRALDDFEWSQFPGGAA